MNSLKTSLFLSLKPDFFCVKCVINHLITVNIRDIIADCYRSYSKGDPEDDVIIRNTNEESHTILSVLY